jgi:hypothetical protein
MKSAVIRIPFWDLQKLFLRGGQHLLDFFDLPADIRLVSVHFDYTRNALALVVESDSFPNIPPGEELYRHPYNVVDRDGDLEAMHAAIDDLKEESSAYRRGLEEGARTERGACAKLVEELTITREIGPKMSMSLAIRARGQS